MSLNRFWDTLSAAEDPEKPGAPEDMLWGLWEAHVDITSCMEISLCLPCLPIEELTACMMAYFMELFGATSV